MRAIKTATRKMLQNLKHRIATFNYQEFFKSLLWAIAVAIIFRTFLFEPFRIPSGSMIPTLQVGDYLFTSKYPYGFSKHSFPFSLGVFEGRILQDIPKRGDIVIFKGVKDPETFYIKRLIGLPGDTVQVHSGIVYINGAPLARRELTTEEMQKLRLPAGDFVGYMETMSHGVSYVTILSNDVNHLTFPDETPVYQVPEGHFFFMGDNRNNSVDSRFLTHIGYIPFDNLVSRADFLALTTDFSIADLVQKGSTNRAFSIIR